MSKWSIAEHRLSIVWTSSKVSCKLWYVNIIQNILVNVTNNNRIESLLCHATMSSVVVRNWTTFQLRMMTLQLRHGGSRFVWRTVQDHLERLFDSIAGNKHHVLHHLLPSKSDASQCYNLRPRTHNFKRRVLRSGSLINRYLLNSLLLLLLTEPTLKHLA